jgi:hypothetical protein
MQRAFRLFAALAALIPLANCDAGTVQLLRDRGVTEDNLALADASAVDTTPPGSVPTSGSASYDGVVAASITGDYVGSLYADLSMSVNFATNSVSGQIDRVDLVDDFTGDVIQNLDGSLTLVGGEAGGVVTATATGVLIAATSGPVSGTGTAVFGLLGSMGSDAATADTVYGSATGAITGGIDLTLSNGEFYGTVP